MDEENAGRMVEIGTKPNISRFSEAEGSLLLSQESRRRIEGNLLPKGNALEAGNVAAILAVKDTPRLIPHCHPIPIHGCEVTWSFDDIVGGFSRLWCNVSVTTNSKTGVEMEALSGVTVGLLTVWDMVKFLEKDESGNYPNTRLDSVKVIEKRKGN